MKAFAFLLSLLILSACTKEGQVVVFDILVKTKDNLPVSDGFVRIGGSRDGIVGTVSLYREEFSPSEKGEVYLEMPLNPEIKEFHVEYWKSSNQQTPQTITGCPAHFCKLTEGQREFNIEITVLE